MRYEIMADNKVRISWDAVTTGVHGAPIKQDSIIYVVNRYPGNVQISDSLRTNCIIDEISPDTLKKYEYTVYSAIGYFYSAPACVTFYHGKPFNTPYVETFDSDGLFDNYDGYDTYTVVDANRDGCTFACSNAFFGNGYVTYKPNKDNGADDWLISPPINLKTGRVYSLLLDARSGRTEYPDQLEVLLGTDTVPANFVKTIMQPKIFNQPSRMMERRHFTVDADGEYRIGIHDITEAGLLHGSEIDKVMVVEEAQFAAPGSVTDLVARAGAKGALTAEISFVTPAKTAEGDVLTYIDSVQVMRDGSVIGVIYNPAVGSAQSFTDKDALEGNNVYSVRAFNQSGPGLVSDCYVVAGNDCPMAPLDGKIADNLDGSCTITWQPSPTVGVNGGYVSPEDLSYNVIRRDVYYDDYATLIIHDELLEELIKERKAVAQVPVSENGEQRAFRNFFIEAVNDKLPDMASEKALTGYIVIGDSYQLPFHDGFSAKSDFCPLWVAESDNGYNWFVANMLSSDADGQCVAFSAVNPGDDATLSTGKIDLGNAANPMLVFRYYALPGVKATLDVHVSKNNVRNGEEDAVWQLDFSNDGNKEGWVPVAIDLNRFKGNGYINITFHATINDTNWPVVIDDVNVRDVHGTDMRAAMCVIPEHITAGSEFNVVASLENYGTEVPAGYTVNLYANGNKVARKRHKPYIYTCSTRLLYC